MLGYYQEKADASRKCLFVHLFFSSIFKPLAACPKQNKLVQKQYHLTSSISLLSSPQTIGAVATILPKESKCQTITYLDYRIQGLMPSCFWPCTILGKAAVD